MHDETVARRYATAVFSLAKEANRVDAVGRNLAGAIEALEADAETRRFYLSPVIERKKKSGVLARAFASLDDITLNTLLLLVRKRREALLGPIGREFAKLALTDAGKEPLEIVSARELAPNEVNQIVVRLARTYGKSFEVDQRVDPALLGGIRITLHDRRIDGSLAGRLDELSRELLGTP